MERSLGDIYFKWWKAFLPVVDRIYLRVIDWNVCAASLVNIYSKKTVIIIE
jgi:hypothetical protein